MEKNLIKSVKLNKVIIFDFDGTLVDSYAIAIDCMNKLAPKYKLSVLNINELEKLRDKSLSQIIKDDLNLRFYKLPFFIRDVQIFMREEIVNIKFCDNIIPILKKLSKNYRLFILSSNHSDIICKKLGENVDLFEAIYAKSSLFKKEKTLLKLIKKFKLNIEDIYYVGDEVRDIEACKKINLDIVSVSWGFNSRKILSTYNPKYLIDKPEELLTIFNNN